MFEQKRLSDYSSSALIEEIRRVDALVGADVLTRKDFAKNARVNITTLSRRFGSWKAALEAAGLADKYGGSGRRVPEGIGRREATDEQILEELRELSRRLGTKVLTSELIQDNLRIAGRTLINRFGSTSAAIEAAGLTASNHGKR
jgi:DNA-binding transcriptional regulator YhcF (GntR family)